MIVAFRAIFVMGRQEYFSAQKDYEDGFQKRRSDAEECDLEAGNGAGEEEEEIETSDHNHQTTSSYSYIDYNSTSYPQEPAPSIPSTTAVSQMIKVPPPANNFPPPPPRNTRSKTQANTDVPIIQPITEPSHEEGYTPYTCAPEVKLVQQNSDLSKFAVVHDPVAAPSVL